MRALVCCGQNGNKHQNRNTNNRISLSRNYCKMMIRHGDDSPSWNMFIFPTKRSTSFGWRCLATKWRFSSFFYEIVYLKWICLFACQTLKHIWLNIVCVFICVHFRSVFLFFFQIQVSRWNYANTLHYIRFCVFIRTNASFFYFSCDDFHNSFCGVCVFLSLVVCHTCDVHNLNHIPPNDIPTILNDEKYFTIFLKRS